MPGEAILNIAFYKFTELSGLPELRAELASLCGRLGLRGTILLASEGINGMIAGPEEPVRALQERLAGIAGLEPLEYKESRSGRVPFGRMLVKIKREIVPLGRPGIRPHERTGARLSPEELKRWLDEGRDVLLIDTRNAHEVAAGTFRGAVHYGLGRFRELGGRLEEKAEELRRESRRRPVVMFCTGGIRCEKATALALELGVENVHQLDGGILRWFERCGGAAWQGECFVFDEREALDPALRPRAGA